MTETQLTFWGGLDTIGGNIVSIQHGKYRIITDFGALFGAELEELMQPELVSKLLAKGHLPKIEGLYPATYLTKDAGVGAYESSDIQTIICLSHLHLDHIGGFGQLPATLPVYALQESVDFYQRLSAIGLLPQFRINWQGVQSDVAFQFGPFTIELVASDHDTLGAASIFITAPDLKVVNSGDFRLSGFHPERVLHWAQKARDFCPDVFLVEGTTFSFDQASRDDRMALEPRLQEATRSISSDNERHLLARFEQVLAEFPTRLFALNVYPQNIERLVYFAEAIARAGRVLVLEPNYYQLLKPYVSASQPLRYIVLNDEKQDLPPADAESMDMIATNPAYYVVQVDYEQQHDYILSIANGIYIHSNGVPLGAYDARYLPWLTNIVEAGWSFYHAHVSGHASQDALRLINYVVQPVQVVPWHTFKPDVYAEALKELGLNPWLPQLHIAYQTSQLTKN